MLEDFTKTKGEKIARSTTKYFKNPTMSQEILVRGKAKKNPFVNKNMAKSLKDESNELNTIMRAMRD